MAWEWGTVKGMVVHHSDSPERDQHSQCLQSAEAIMAYHERNGYTANGAYTRFGCHHGYIFAGKGFGISSEANGTYEANRTYPALCILGDSPKPSPGVVRAIQAFRQEVLTRWPNATEVLPHSAVTQTACPGDPLRNYINNKEYEEGSVALTLDEEKFLKNFIKKCEDLGIGPFTAARAAQVIENHKTNHPSGDGGGAHSHQANVTLS